MRDNGEAKCVKRVHFDLRTQIQAYRSATHWIPTTSRAQCLTFDLYVEASILNSNFPLLVVPLLIVLWINSAIKHHDSFTHLRAKAILQSLSLTNINSRFLFVPCQDPDLDVCLHQSLNGLGHLILELVLYRCGPQQLQVLHPKWGKSKKKREKKSVRSDYNRGRPLKRQVSKKHVCRDCVTHSVTFFPSSAALVYHAERPQRAFRGIGYATMALCVCASADTTAPIQARPHNTLSVFFPGNLVVLWDWLQAHIGPKQGQIFDKTQG